MEFQPILILAVIWLLIGLPLSKLNQKAKQQQAARSAKPGAKNAADGKNQPAARQAQAPVREPARPAVMQPTITVTEHDDSIYQGSLNAVTGEGYDPCHDSQLAPLTLAETETAVPAAETQAPGLQLGWTGSEIVRGFVMSEILTRKS